jgi:Pyridoxamine 5'-phosphate oxidase
LDECSRCIRGVGSGEDVGKVLGWSEHDRAERPGAIGLGRVPVPTRHRLAEQTELMASFSDVQNVEPHLANRARAILTSTTNAVLGTLRHDGSPRLSGVDPFFHNGQLRIWSMPRARKGEDLRRDPRLALHSIPWDSRGLRDGAANVGAADAKVSGTATVTTDPGELAAFRAWLKSERGFEPPEDWDLFTIDIDGLTVISADAGQLVIDRWSTTDGRQTIRRS